MPRRTVMIIALVVVVIAAAAIGGISWWQSRIPSGPECTVPQQLTSTSGEIYDVPLGLTAVQLQHASTINAVGLARDLPERARVLALATAWQESSLRNISYGDRDSLGLFQQRPSQGWGEIAELQDPIYAANAFYDELERVSGWQDMPLTEAAQAVQRSGHPEAYAKWENDAQALADALGGTEPLEVTCRRGALASTAPAPHRPPLPGTSSAAPQLQELLAAAAAEFAPGDVNISALAVTTGTAAPEATAPATTATVTLALDGTDSQQSARALAAWTVAHATGYSVESVTVGNQHWEKHVWEEIDTSSDTPTDTNTDTSTGPGVVTITVAAE